ncbi:Uncharacterised protein r2_g1974 [Pycnogonum litorale]
MSFLIKGSLFTVGNLVVTPASKLTDTCQECSRNRIARDQPKWSDIREGWLGAWDFNPAHFSAFALTAVLSAYVLEWAHFATMGFKPAPPFDHGRRLNLMRYRRTFINYEKIKSFNYI